MKKYILILLCTALLAAITSEFTEPFFEKHIFDIIALFKDTKLVNTAGFRTDEKGVLIIDYGYIFGKYIGEKHNPLAIANNTLEYHSMIETDSAKYTPLFFNSIDWILENLETHPMEEKEITRAADSLQYTEYATLVYDYDWELLGLTDPWWSGSANSHSIQALIRAHQIRPDSVYIEAIEKLLNSFYISTTDEGVLYYTEDQGWWYEEYADIDGLMPRTLNGMIFTLKGLWECYKYTDNQNAKQLFDNGFLSLVNNIETYDKNGYTYSNSLKMAAYHNYHRLHIRLLNELLEIRENEKLAYFRDRWQSYYDYPYVVRLFMNFTKALAVNYIANFGIWLLLLLAGYFIIRSRAGIRSS